MQARQGLVTAVALAFCFAPGALLGADVVLSAEDNDWWDGFAPAPSGQGLTDPTLAQVTAFTEYNLELIAGGDFSSAGGVAVRKIARWNGNRWAPLGVGLNAAPTCFAAYNGSLIVGGYFTEAGGVPVNHIARWDGEAWYPLGEGVNDFVKALVVISGRLYVGGQFTMAGGIPAGRIARWDGASWSNVGDFNSRVESLIIRNDRVVAGGMFTQVGALPANRVAEWYSNAWHALGSGTSGRVRALAVYRGDLVAGGYFSSAGGGAVSNLARWNGTSWSPLGSGVDGEVFALAPYRKALVAGGAFTQAGGAAAASIARWNGSSWAALGSGVDDDVQALHQDYTHLYVGGRFATAGANPAACIARWDDTPVSTHRFLVAADGGGEYVRVQDAADLATHGDTIEVAPGFYAEHVYISGKRLLIRGEAGREVTTLRGIDWSMSGTEESDGAVFRGFTLLEHSGFGPSRVNCSVQQCAAMAGCSSSGNGVNQATRFEWCLLGGGLSLNYDGYLSAATMSSCECRDGDVTVFSEAGARVSDCGFEASSLLLHGGDYAELSRCRFASGSSATVTGEPSVHDNRWSDAGGLTVNRGFFGTDVSGNSLLRSAGIVVNGQGNGRAFVEENILSRCSTGISVAGNSASIVANTILGCAGAGIAAAAAPLTLSRNLVVQNDAGISLLGNPELPVPECNDVWSNPGGDWLGIANPTGIDGNIAADPLFCGVTFDDLRLAEDSPCAPGAAPACGRIGALDVGCGLSVAVDANEGGDIASFIAPVPLRIGSLLSWRWGAGGPCRIEVFSLSGRRVSSLEFGVSSAAWREMRWTGLDDAGRALPSGLYWAVIRAGDTTTSRKLLYLR